mgnify:CR=1 FL=1
MLPVGNPLLAGESTAQWSSCQSRLTTRRRGRGPTDIGNNRPPLRVAHEANRLRTVGSGQTIGSSSVEAEDFRNIVAGLFVRRDSTIFGHCTFTRVVRRECELEVAGVPAHEAGKLTDSAADVFLGVERIVHSKPFRGFRHQLHQTHSPLAADRSRIIV